MDVETRYLKLSAADLKAVLNPLLTAGRPVLDADGREVAKVVQQKGFEKAMVQAGSLEIVEAPRLLVYEMTRSSMSLQRSHPYVRDRVWHEDGDKRQVLPVLDTVLDGFTVELSAALLPDDGCGIRFQSTWSTLLEMKNTTKTLGDKEYPVEEPVVDQWVARGSTVVAPGELLVFLADPGGGAGDGVRRLAVVAPAVDG